jgi:hypothetical protein
MPYAATTLATLRARLQDRFTGDPFWSATEANDAINEALRYFNLFTGYWRGTATAATTINVAFVTVPTTLTKNTRVYVAGRALVRKSIVELYRTRRNWRTQTTASGSPVPTTIREWAPIGVRQVAIWPTDAVGGTTLSFDAVKLTPILTADGNFLDLGDEEINLILAEALYILAFKRPSILEAMAEKHKLFMTGCVERNDQLRASAFFRHTLGLDQEQRLLHARRVNEALLDDQVGGA